MSEGQTHKKQTAAKKRNVVPLVLLWVILGCSSIVLITILLLFLFDNHYSQKIYPHIYIEHQHVGGKTPLEIQQAWEQKNKAYSNAYFEFILGETIATVSGQQLHMGYDSNLLAKQAYLVGRSGNTLSDLYTKIFKSRTDIQPYFRWNQDILLSTLSHLAETVEVQPEDARFSFINGKVVEFIPAKEGKQMNKTLALQQFEALLPNIPYSNQVSHPIVLEVQTVQPTVSTSESNNYGIIEKLGTGYSEFKGSIPSRVHNVALAASKFNGVLIPPDSIISFNQLIGDISSSTGYQSAYIIKDGRTVLGDGGGVCQMSTTLFRAVLNAGLPIIERTPHAYRVGYYEQAGYKPGLDATIFSPSVDLKIKNDTPAHILIVTNINKSDLTLTVEIYGTHDGRIAEIVNHQISNKTPAPPPLFQDDPTLPPNTQKQVDWAAEGARTEFTYKVKREGETLIDQTFYSNYRPWQAVYLKGPQT